MRVGIVGATGMVGQNIMTILKEVKFPISELILMASEKSVGIIIDHAGFKSTVISIEEGLKQTLDIVFFAAGGAVSEAYAQQFAEQKSYVIDNSSAFRMLDHIPLIVPEVNGNTLTKEDYLISNPNCSTSQLVMALSPLSKRYGLNQVIVSTYQSVSGSGVAGIDQLEREEKGEVFDIDNSCYTSPIYRNVVPHIDTFLDNGYTKEEIKLMEESKKILGLPTLKISATAVRVPVIIGHSESVTIILKEAFENIQELKNVLNDQEGVIVEDQPEKFIYPTPLKAADQNEVFVGRIRADLQDPKTMHCWVVSDNLRKGAAYNAVQIAQLLHRNFLS